MGIFAKFLNLRRLTNFVLETTSKEWLCSSRVKKIILIQKEPPSAYPKRGSGIKRLLYKSTENWFIRILESFCRLFLRLYTSVKAVPIKGMTGCKYCMLERTEKRKILWTIENNFDIQDLSGGCQGIWYQWKKYSLSIAMIHYFHSTPSYTLIPVTFLFSK